MKARARLKKIKGKVLEGKMDQLEGRVHEKLGQVERKAKRVMW